MATLVLSAAGAALGGPAGAAVGRFAGRQLDRSFGASAARRLSDLRLPSAQYGDPIPAVFGRMRVAGVVLWVSKPVATAVVSKTGSAQSQSVSFALAVSSTKVDEIGRIWADGRLIRDAARQQSVAFTLRLHDGNEDQPSDSLIAATEGEALTPAYRGTAYLVFEDFDLSTFGNRLPLITAELSSSGQPLTAEWLLQEGLGLLPTADESESFHALEGGALAGDDAAEALAPFVEAIAPSFSFGGDGWSLGRVPEHHLIDAELWASLFQSTDWIRRDLRSRMSGPTRVSLRYFDPELDFAAGEKSARLPGPERLRRIELPATMAGAKAKALALAQLAERQHKNEHFWLRLPVSFSRIAVGNHVSSEDAPDQRWVVCEKRLSLAGVILKLGKRIHSAGEHAVEAGGVATLQHLAMRPHSVALLELPGDQATAKPSVAVVVTGGATPYQQVPVSLSVGGSTTQILSSPAEGACGVLLEELFPAPSELVDGRSLIKVRFADDPLLTSCDRSALIAGANLMWIGGEFLQFATAKPIDTGEYLLSDLLRGRFGSEVQAPHAVGTTVIVLDAVRFRPVDLDVSSIDAEIAAELVSGDGASAMARLLIEGLAAMPWRPAHLKVDDVPQGLSIRWVPRSKAGSVWLDFVDSPLGYARETYSVCIESADGSRVEKVVNEPSCEVDLQALALLGPRPWAIEVRQVGDLVPGKPSRILI